MANINYIEKHTTTFKVKQHKHPFWEIMYVTAGDGVIETCNGYKLNYSKNDIICIPPNLFHENNSSEGFRNIHFTIDDFFPPINIPILLRSSALNRDFGVFASLAYRYFHLFSPEHPLNASITAAIVILLNNMFNQPEGNRYSQDVATEIISNFTDPYFNLTQAYENIPQSKEYTRKQFIKQYGFSPSDFLKLKRIEHAKYLLSKRNYERHTITEIAYSCGFNDVAYFSKVFKRETGVSPNRYKINVATPDKYHENDKET